VIAKHCGTFGAVGLAFGGMECLSESMRGKDDFWNGVAGGFAAGSVVAVRAGNPSAMFFTGAHPS
jgi:import inner membrane translocase subunit TIM22